MKIKTVYGFEMLRIIEKQQSFQCKNFGERSIADVILSGRLEKMASQGPYLILFENLGGIRQPLIAHSTIVMLRYIFLSLEQRRVTDPRTLGLLFHTCCNEVKALSFLDALYRILGSTTALLEGKSIPPKITEVVFQAIIAHSLQHLSLLNANHDEYYAQAG